MGLDLSAEDVARLEGVGRRVGSPDCNWRRSRCGIARTSPASSKSFSGSHRDVLDFLAEEVLDRQPEQVQEFLLETSILDDLTGPLCDALTGRSDGQEMLERLERENLFVVALDDERGWYRYHHLFAEFLRGHLGRESGPSAWTNCTAMPPSGTSRTEGSPPPSSIRSRPATTNALHG